MAKSYAHVFIAPYIIVRRKYSVILLTGKINHYRGNQYPQEEESEKNPSQTCLEMRAINAWKDVETTSPIKEGRCCLRRRKLVRQPKPTSAQWVRLGLSEILHILKISFIVKEALGQVNCLMIDPCKRGATYW